MQYDAGEAIVDPTDGEAAEEAQVASLRPSRSALTRLSF